MHISVGTATGTPTIALPLAKDDGQHRYELGKIRITEPGSLPLPTPQSTGRWW